MTRFGARASRRFPGCVRDETAPESALEAIHETAEVFVELMLERGEEDSVECVSSGTAQAVVAVNIGVRSLAF